MRLIAEWICSRCGELHRLNFEICRNTFKATRYRKTELFEQDGIVIQDTKERILYAQPKTELTTIIEALKSYLLGNTAIKENTLIIEACRN